MNFGRLFLDRHVLVDDADTAPSASAIASGDVVTVSIAALMMGMLEFNVRGELRAHVRFAGENLGRTGNEQTSSNVKSFVFLDFA